MSGERRLLRQQREEMGRQYGGARQQQPWHRYVGGQHYQQLLRQQQQQHAGICLVGNTGRGWYHPESPWPPEASMRGIYKCEQCGALGHNATICKAPNAIKGALRTCGEYGYMSRKYRIAHDQAHVVDAVPPAMDWPPSALAERAAIEAETAAWQEKRVKNQARVEALNVVEEFQRN